MAEKVKEVETQTLAFAPELDRAYRLYAAKTIEDRALPDVRDGCKPVQRRILYSMHDMGLRADGPHRKCARIVGDVLGKYHPHGEPSVYGALVRMAQPFALRETLVDGQGNFGSVDGDSAAAMRYTESRLSPVGEELLRDIDVDTVEMVENFDGSLTEPAVLPTALPNLLVNGASGIAVGMATNIPPHNLGEIAAAVLHVVENWSRRGEITTDELMAHVPGPDFPTGGVVYRYREWGGEVRDTIRSAYEHGRGRMVTQARMHQEEIGGGKTNIVVSELPYTVQTSTLLERIAKEVKDGRIKGVTDLRDESDFDTGMRLVIEVSRTADPAEVLQDLLRYSQLQVTFGCNNLALVPDPDGDGMRPRLLTLRDMLVYFVGFRLEVIERRSRHELAKREERLHIVEGLLKALDDIDTVVEIIRGSDDPETAHANLCQSLGLSEEQAKAILDMPLRRLTSLETDKLREEQKELRARIKLLRQLVDSEVKRLEVVGEETLALSERHATPRRTVIIDSEDSAAGTQVVTETDLRKPEGRQMILVTTNGVERRPATGFRYVRSPGLTSRATTSQLSQIRAEPSDRVLLISASGRAWSNQVGFVPEKAPAALLGLAKGDRVVAAAVLGDPDECLVLGTRSGRVKRTRVGDLSLTDGKWSRVVGFAEDDDEVLFAAIAGDGAALLFATEAAQVLRTDADAVNPQASGTARGVAGMGVRDGDRLISGAVVPASEIDGAGVYVVSAEGYCKRVPLTEIPAKGRAGQGVRVLNITASTGPVAAVAIGPPGAGLDVVFENGRRHHVPAEEVPEENRYNRGKLLVSVADAEAPIVGAAAL